jgi:hypothetical protein
MVIQNEVLKNVLESNNYLNTRRILMIIVIANGLVEFEKPITLTSSSDCDRCMLGPNWFIVSSTFLGLKSLLEAFGDTRPTGAEGSMIGWDSALMASMIIWN